MKGIVDFSSDTSIEVTVPNVLKLFIYRYKDNYELFPFYWDGETYTATITADVEWGTTFNLYFYSFYELQSFLVENYNVELDKDEWNKIKEYLTDETSLRNPLSRE